MGDMKHVKVDNWGAFFLQKLKHFFNRTDYCDLTLQFQDNAQLKVHRLVLNACTEYFEVLERTCEMYEDCLIMPDDLQADVVVPIVNFMYTGQLEYKPELLNRLYQTAQIMNMSVLTKLLDAHRSTPQAPKPAPPKYKKPNPNSYSRTSSTTKRVESKVQIPARKVTAPLDSKPTPKPVARQLHSIYTEPTVRQNTTSRKHQKLPARPTRYEIPEELDREDIFDNSFSDLSYESKPLVTHPLNEYAKQKEDEGPSTSDFRNIMKRPADGDMVEFKRLKTEDSLFGDPKEFMPQEDPLDDPFDFLPKTKQHSNRQLQESSVIEMGGAKVTIETRPGNDKPIDHAKIISEVLKKYPHLVKNNKNIKLKIVNNNPKQALSKSVKKVTARIRPSTSTQRPNIKKEERDFVYETDIVDTKEIRRLVALGIENVKGPWLCLICGTPGKALNFTSYHKFRNHLVEVHNERQPSNMCEFCGLKSGKRNHLLHHVYTKHGVPPPPSYHFPRCNQCSYIALTQAFLVKHKLTHNEPRLFSCNVCQGSFRSTTQLLEHIQRTGHKICPDRKSNLQCIYCMKTFLRESNLYAHLKSTHKSLARNDGIIDASDEDEEGEEEMYVKREPVQEESGQSMEEDEDDLEENDHQYQIQQEFRNIQIINKNLKVSNQKILNQSLSPVIEKRREIVTTPVQQRSVVQKTSVHQPAKENIILMNADYQTSSENEYIISDMQNPELECENILPEVHLTQPGVSSELLQKTQPPQLINKPISHPYQIVVSSEQEYKALMAANPSIIFHDGTESRPMAVMGHSSQNIDLDPAHDNNMMIIQDDYQINVSESLSGNNSNIVVVYSQNMQTQGLQFSEQQMLAEQNMDTQLIPTSEVITTNAGCDGLQSEMIIEEAGEHWQGEIQESSQLVHQQPMTCNIEIKPEPSAMLEQTPIIVDTGLTEQTELQIVGPSTEATGTIASGPSQMTEENTTDAQDQGVDEFNQEQISDNVGSKQQSVSEQCEESVLVINQNNIPDGMLSQMEIDHQEQIVGTEHPDVLSSIEDNIEENTVMSAESELSENMSREELPVSHEVVKERIKNLTADWSDDETPKGNVEDIPSANETMHTDMSQSVREVATTDTSELEESIENIQEEMKNQVPCTPPSKRIIITSDITLPSTAAAALISKSRSSAEKAEQVISTIPVLSDDSLPTNKITSLLTDWDDNDSEPQPSDAKVIDPSPQAEQETPLTEAVLPKGDTVKTVQKIMSDWEDEEEK